jgi:hypothetical protein
VWRRRRKAASAAALYSAHHGLYSEAVVSSIVSAVALAEVGQFREAVQYVQRAAKALYEVAREAFERIKVAAQRLVELFVEAVTRVLAWADEHKAYHFLMTAVAAGAIALATALNMWGLVEMEKLAYAVSLTPFVPAGVEKYSREETFNILREAPDPYEKFKEIAKAAIAKNEKLQQPWESLRVLIMPKRSEEERLMSGRGAELYSKYREDENYKRALFYAVCALEETFGVYRTALRKYVETVQRVEVGEEPFKRVMYVADLGRLAQLAEKEEATFEEALSALRKRLNEYAVKYGLRDLLDVKEDVARRLAEAKQPELPEFGGVSFGTKAYAALVAYREYMLGRRGAYSIAAWHWLEVGGSAWLLYYAPYTACSEAEKAKVERPTAVEEMIAEAFRRLFLKPSADHYCGFVEELAKVGTLALEPVEEKTNEEKKSKEKTESYVFRLFRVEEDGGLKELGVKLKIGKVGKGAGIIYALKLNAKWQAFFRQELGTVEKAVEEVRARLPVEDSLPYMLGWVNSDVAIIAKKRNRRALRMSTSYLWQLVETKVLFGWSYINALHVGLTLEGPKPQFNTHTSLEKLDDTIRRSAEGGWLKMLGVETESWDGLKRWVAKNWDIVVDVAVRRLGEGVRSELEALKNRLNDDKVAREVVAPALLLIQAEKLGVNEATLRYFAAVASGAIGGDGYVSAAMRVIDLASGKREIALLWAVALAAYGIEAEVRRVGSVFHVVASGDDAVRLAGLYFRYAPPLLEGDDRLKNHKLDEAMKLAAEGLGVGWEGLRKTPSGLVAADLTISVGGAAVEYNVYLRNKVELRFESSDQSRAVLAARLLRLAGVSAEVEKDGDRGVWRIVVYTYKLATGHEKLRKALAEIIRRAAESGWVEAGKTERWLEKLEKGLTLKEGWPKYKVRLAKGALEVRFTSTDPNRIEQEEQRFMEMGLEKGWHFTVKMPEDGKPGHVYISKEGMAYTAWLSVYGEGKQRELAVEFVEYILRRAWEAGEKVYEKAKEIIEEGKARGSLKLEGFEKEVEVDGRRHKVKVIDGGAELDKSGGGKLLLRIRITAEVDGVRREYTITYGRYGDKNETKGYAYASTSAPGGREADAERFSALIKALTGEEPGIIEKDNETMIVCYERHLRGFRLFAEFVKTIEEWLKKTRDR